MRMSEEMAVRLHRMMWSDMQKELGDNPSVDKRENYKTRWISKHFPGAMVHHSCFLCEFTQAPYANSQNCKNCPIKWPNDICIDEGADANTNYISSPISEILTLPARNKEIEAKHDETAIVRSYYKYREDLLSKASGIPASTSIDDHVKAIREKAREEGYETAKEYLAECSGLSQDKLVFDHIKAIQEKAVEDYFKKTPGAKLATMDVDQAFKQYAKEQMEPIFKQLSEASGLSENNQSVCSHINWIKNKARQEGRDETKEQMKDLLAKESNLDRNRPVDDHIREIVKKSTEVGAAEERDRIQEKVYEVLLS